MQDLYHVWIQRLKLRAEGNKLKADGKKRRVEGYKLWADGKKRRAEGDKLRAEGDKLRAEGDKLWAEGDKLYAEGDKLWADAISKVYGNIKLKWKNWNERFQSYECHLENREVFGFDIEKLSAYPEFAPYLLELELKRVIYG